MISVLKVECSSGNDVGSVVFMVTVQYHSI
nr:MAG TPA: hypothetical protein [Caudoviricetes sp.]